jgi:hypothetical protein
MGGRRRSPVGANGRRRRGAVGSALLADSLATFPHTLAPRRPTPQQLVGRQSRYYDREARPWQPSASIPASNAEVWRPEQ